ncbi:MAG: hypothetical protein L0Y56_17795 [Nitrospira sp.]|nr:hypothetical protein [Nitrospira sp.]
MRQRGVFIGYDALLLEKLQGGELTQSLVRPHGVIDFLPLEQFLVQINNRLRGRCDFVKFFGMGAVGPFHSAVELRAFGRQDEQTDAQLLTGLFELGKEFGAAINLESSDGKGHALLEGVQED